MKKFTDMTWATAAPGGYLNKDARNRVRGWMAAHDLAVEMAEAGMEFKLARLLVDATLSGNPIVVKRRGLSTEVITETVIVEHLNKPHKGGGLMHISTWGMGHPIYFSQIIAAGTPERVFEFDARGEHHVIRHPAFGKETHTVEPVEELA